MRRRSLVIVPLATIVFGYWAYLATSDLRTAVAGAQQLEGTIASVEGRKWDTRITKRRYRNRPRQPDYYRVEVTFTTPDGRELTRVAQADGPKPDDIEFDTDSFRDTGLAVGDKVTLLYHPELGDLVWIDDFWLLWIFPLFLCLAALLATAVVAVGALSLWGRPRGAKAAP